MLSKRTQTYSQQSDSGVVLLSARYVLFGHGGMAEEPVCPNRLELAVAFLALTILMDSPDRILQMQPQYTQQFPFKSNLCFGCKNKLWFWGGEMLKGIVGTQMLRGFGV